MSASKYALIIGFWGAAFAAMMVEWVRVYFSSANIVHTTELVIVGEVLAGSSSVAVIILLLTCILLLPRIAATRSHSILPKPTAMTPLAVVPRRLLAGWSAIIYLVQWKTFLPNRDWNLVHVGVDQSTNVFVLLFGIALSEFLQVIMLSLPQRENTHRVLGLSKFCLISLLTATSFFPAVDLQIYKYHSQRRLTCMFVNPNTFGLIMAVDLVLLCAAIIELRSTTNLRPVFRRLIVTVAILSSLYVTVQLLLSFSRGAFVAALCGLFICLLSGRESKRRQRAFFYDSSNYIGRSCSCC
jgi:hypothetical protein